MASTEDRSEVESVVRGVYEAISDVDADRLDSFFDRDEVFAFGRRADSRHDAWATLREEHAAEFAPLTRIDMISADLRVSVDGDVAWTSDRIHQRVHAVDGREAESDGRLTLVLRRRSADGAWKVVQFHASAGL